MSATRSTQQSALPSRVGTNAGVLSTQISTETALTAFALVPAAVGGLGQILASRRLSRVESDTVSLARMGLPIGLAIAGTIAGAVLVPTSG